MIQEVIEEGSKKPKHNNGDSIGVSGYVIGFFFLLIIFSFVGSVAWLSWDAWRYTQVASAEDAGRITVVSFQDPSFSPASTTIETGKGTFLVMGVMQGVNGHRVRIENRANGLQVICDMETDTCLRVHPPRDVVESHKTMRLLAVCSFIMLLFCLPVVFWANSEKKASTKQSKDKESERDKKDGRRLSWAIPLVDAGDESGGLVLEFPPDLLQYMDWQEGGCS